MSNKTKGKGWKHTIFTVWDCWLQKLKMVPVDKSLHAKKKRASWSYELYNRNIIPMNSHMLDLYNRNIITKTFFENQASALSLSFSTNRISMKQKQVRNSITRKSQFLPNYTIEKILIFRDFIKEKQSRTRKHYMHTNQTIKLTRSPIFDIALLPFSPHKTKTPPRKAANHHTRDLKKT